MDVFRQAQVHLSLLSILFIQRTKLHFEMKTADSNEPVSPLSYDERSYILPT